MTEEKFIEIMENENIKTEWNGCNACQGLDIIRKYLPDKGIERAESWDDWDDSAHDIIYSVGISELVEAGITKEDVTKLRALNWILDRESEGLACFV